MSHGPHLNDIFRYKITKIVARRILKVFSCQHVTISKLILLIRRRVLVFASTGKWESPTAKGHLLGVRLLKKTVC